MRIAVMLRAYDRPGGIGIYARNIVKHLLAIDKSNHYVLLHNNKNNLGIYAENENVDEVFVDPANQFVWDQLAVRRELSRWDADLVFNTKFSVPLFCKRKRVMVLHGSSWFVHPELYGSMDIMYVKAMMPVYCKASDFLISNSDLTTNDFINIVGVPRSKIKTVRLAAADNFKPVEDLQYLGEVREKYSLPDIFALTVSSYDPRKNFATLIDAFERCRREVDLHLVVIGKDCERYSSDYDLETRGLSSYVHFPGWVDQSDLPAIYSQAKVYVFPSVYEEFGIPVVEAIACGCPVVSSNTGAIPELIGGVARLCDPFDARALSQNILDIVESGTVVQQMRSAGLSRAKDFSWDKVAQETLGILEAVAS